MKTENEIEAILSRQMHGAWKTMDHQSRLAAVLAYIMGERDGIDEGFDQGFQVGCAAERGIVAVQKKIDEIEQYELNSTDLEAAQAPDILPKDLAHNPSGAGSVHPVFEQIIDILGNVHGSGYEGRRK